MPHEHADNGPDSTAARVALWRALHAKIDPPPHVLDDTIGLQLLAPPDDWQQPGDMDPTFTQLFRASIGVSRLGRRPYQSLLRGANGQPASAGQCRRTVDRDESLRRAAHKGRRMHSRPSASVSQMIDAFHSRLACVAPAVQRIQCFSACCLRFGKPGGAAQTDDFIRGEHAEKRLGRQFGRTPEGIEYATLRIALHVVVKRVFENDFDLRAERAYVLQRLKDRFAQQILSHTQP